MTAFSFGPFVLDVPGARLVRDGADVRLRPQAFRVLRALVEHRGDPLGYEQMIAEAWQGTHVSRHTVDVTVGEVRRTLAEYGSWIAHRPKVGYSLVVPTSEELVRKGWHFASRRTKEGTDRAIDCFQQAAAHCPDDFRAFEGLSTCYLMQATFSMAPPQQVYPLFLGAHARAVEIGGLSAELRCNRAHGLHMFEHRPHQAEEEFGRALAAKPTCATAHVRMALLCATLGDLARAWECVTAAHRVDPLLPTVPASQVLVQTWRRDFAAAVALGQSSVELHPYLPISRANYAHALELVDRREEALLQYRMGSVMSGDLPWMRAFEGACLAQLGRRSEAHAILDELTHRRDSEYVDAVPMAVLRVSLRSRKAALDELERGLDERSAFLYAIDVDPRMDVFRRESRFAKVRAALQALRDR